MSADKTWPEGEAERALCSDWREEVWNGETVLGFRDWLANRAEVGR